MLSSARLTLSALLEAGTISSVTWYFTVPFLLQVPLSKQAHLSVSYHVYLYEEVSRIQPRTGLLLTARKPKPRQF